MLFNFRLLVILSASVFFVNSLNLINFPNDLYSTEANKKYKPIAFKESIKLKDNSPENILDHEILPSVELSDLSLPREVHDQQTPIRSWKSLADKKNCNVNVDVSRRRDEETNTHLDASRDVWKSQDGWPKIEASEHYDRNIEDSQPEQPKENCGDHVSFSHRRRRSPQSTPPFNPQARNPQSGNPQQGGFGNPNAPHGNVNVGVEHQRGSGTQLHIDANQDLWKSRNGRTSFQGNVFYDRNLGRNPPGIPRSNYGGQIQFNHRF